MKNVTKIAGIIAMVAILALAVSCSKNEGSGGTSSENAVPAAAKSGDGLAGTVWEGTRQHDGVVVKYTFAETDSMVLQQRDNGETYQGFYKVFGDTVMFTWDTGAEGEYTRSGDSMTNKEGSFTATKVK